MLGEVVIYCAEKMRSNGAAFVSSRYSQKTERNVGHHHVPTPANLASSSASSSFSSVSSKSLGHGQTVTSARTRASVSRRSVTPTSRSHSFDAEDDPKRVRVAVRLRPKNAEDHLIDADFADCVELQPETKRLKLRKNNWNSESYRFDEVFTETASQRRIYEVVAKPVIESVLNGYNGTIMAYGQTGTGKTYTLGRLGKDDASDRGIMVRALEDIISGISPASDKVAVSYLQLYMESIQDLLAPDNVNIPISEDHKSGEVSVPGATVVDICDLDQFLRVLEIGEANRHAANTKLNTESSRSHAILMVCVRRSVQEKVENKITSLENGIPVILKSKLLVVDLAGSERINKSGSEGHLLEEAKFINLSLTSLGKCINALAEKSSHIPTRDSKLTRLLRDSFGGSARTSLIVTIGPSARHHAETASTIMFGQRAMKIVNMIKLKEEFDFESLCRTLEIQVDHLTVELERQQKLREDDKRILEKQLRETKDCFAEAEKNFNSRSEFFEAERTRQEKEMTDMLMELNLQRDHNDLMLEKVGHLEMSLEHTKQHQHESYTHQKVLVDTTQMYEKKIADLTKQFEDEHTRSVRYKEELEDVKRLLRDHKNLIKQYETENSTYQKALADTAEMYEKKMMELLKKSEDKMSQFISAEEQLNSAKRSLTDRQKLMQKEVDAIKVKLEETCRLHENTTDEFQILKSKYKEQMEEKAKMSTELLALRQKLLEEEKQRKAIEAELLNLRNVPENENMFEDKKSYPKENIYKGSFDLGAQTGMRRMNQLREANQQATIAKICEEVGLERILHLLTSEDSDIQIHAVKVIANLAAEDGNQERIVVEGGLDSLLMLLQSTQNPTIIRVASGAIANLAMSEMNQTLIMNKGGAHLLARISSKTDDPQTLRMVAGALANLCGNEKTHKMLKEDGGIQALMGMVGCGNTDVVAQVARGLANFAKCESREIVQGRKKGRSLLMEYGSLAWLVDNSRTAATSIRRHVELALCHLAQNGDNASDFVMNGGVKELGRISVESSREDIRNLAKKTLKSNSIFQAEMHHGA